MAKFKVGDVCIIVKTDTLPEIIGEEVVITAAPKECKSKYGKQWIGYPTDLILEGGRQVCPPESYLRLKDNPPDAIVMREYNRLIEKLTGKVPA